MIIHMTTVHPRDDSRIRHKEIPTLRKELNDEVELFVQDGLGDEFDEKSQFWIRDTGKRNSRFLRMTEGGFRMITAVLKRNPKIVYFHDPELLPWAMILKSLGIKVIYDVHEDYPRVIFHNLLVPKLLKPLLFLGILFFEKLAGIFFDGILGAGPEITKRFPKRKTALLRNFAVLEELKDDFPIDMQDRKPDFCYVGLITKTRGIIEMIEATSLVKSHDVRLNLAGHFPLKDHENEAFKNEHWGNVNFKGRLSKREDIKALLTSSRAGLLVLKPVKHEMISWPIKLFEYMCAGIPVIASNFPHWEKIINEMKCGLLVDPESPKEISEAMEWILNNPEEAKKMGDNGRKAAEKYYSWEIESINMIKLHNKILK